MIYQTWIQCFLTLLVKLYQMKRSKTYLFIRSFEEIFKLFLFIAFLNQCHIALDGPCRHFYCDNGSCRMQF